MLSVDFLNTNGDLKLFQRNKNCCLEFLFVEKQLIHLHRIWLFLCYLDRYRILRDNGHDNGLKAMCTPYLKIPFNRFVLNLVLVNIFTLVFKYLFINTPSLQAVYTLMNVGLDYLSSIFLWTLCHDLGYLKEELRNCKKNENCLESS